MAGELRRDTLFTALTRPQMFAGVTYSYFVLNAIITIELFLIFKSFEVLLASLILQLVGVLGQLNRHSRRTSAFHPKRTFSYKTRTCHARGGSFTLLLSKASSKCTVFALIERIFPL